MGKHVYLLFLALFLIQSTIELQPRTQELIQKITWPETNYHGLIPITEVANADLFYWWFPSRRSREKDPLLIWFTGGPSCASEIALFEENGPFKFNSKTSEVTTNPYSWNNQANLMYVDQPLGSGYSQADLPYKSLPKNEQEISEQIYEFLLKFYTKFPEFKGRDVYIAGESYSGHFLPNFGTYIVNKKNPDMVLKGIAIGNGIVDPSVQFDPTADYMLHNSIITHDKYYELKGSFKHCESMIKRGSVEGFSICTNLLMKEITFPPNHTEFKFNLYDITKKSDGFLQYNFDPLIKFLDLKAVKEDLDVMNRNWKPCNDPAADRLTNDMVNNCAPLIGELLDKGIKIMAYHGDLDLMANWMGGLAYVDSIPWSGQPQWESTQFYNIGYGLKRKWKNLEFIKFSNAGHMVPMDQPVNALKMITQFMDQDDNGETDAQRRF